MPLKVDIPLFRDNQPTPAATSDAKRAYYENNVALVSPQYRATSMCGTGLNLGATNELPIPLQYDLGAEELIGASWGIGAGDSDLSASVNTTSSLSMSITSIGTGQSFAQMDAGAMDTGSSYIFSFDIVVNSGTFLFVQVTNGTVHIINDILSSGHYEYIINPAPNDTYPYFVMYFRNDNLFNVEMTNISVKEITTTGYLTYETEDSVLQLESGVDFTGTTYTLADDTYRWAYVNENQFSEADLVAIAEESNKIVEFAMDGTGLTNTKGVNDKFFGFRENSGEFCIDAIGYGNEIIVNGTFQTDLSGWSVFSPGTGNLYWTENGILFANSEGTSNTYVKQNMQTFESGKTYQFKVKTTSETTILGATVYLLNGDTLGNYGDGIRDGEYIVTTITANNDYDGFMFRGGDAAEDYTVSIISTQDTTAEIANYNGSIRTSIANSQTSIQWTCAELDGAGVPTAYNSVANTAIMHSDTNISTGFKPSIAQYSIEETITGELQDFGSEVIVNGDFLSGTTGWTFSGTCSVINEELDFANGSLDLAYQENMEENKTYLVQFDILTLSGTGTFRCAYGSGIDNTIVAVTEIGTYAVEYTHLGTNLAFGFRSVNMFATIDNISVKELTTKTQRTEARLLTHNSNALSDELVVNGTFDTDLSGWTNAGCTWDASQRCHLLSDGSNITINQQNVFDITKEVAITFDIEINYGAVVISVNVLGAGIAILTSSGTYSYVVPANTSLDGAIRFSRNFDGTGVPTDAYIDNVSTKEVSTENKYYINGLDQAVTPALPDPDTTINLNDTAVIGYPDIIQMRRAEFNVHSEVITPTLVNLYPNWRLSGGSDIVQDVPTGGIPTGHSLAFNSANPCDATYVDNEDGTYSYIFNPAQESVRLGINQVVTGFEVGKTYRFQAMARALTDAPTSNRLRVIHMLSETDLVVTDGANVLINQNTDYVPVWMDFEVTASTGSAIFRHGIGLFSNASSEQQIKDIGIYELDSVIKTTPCMTSDNMPAPFTVKGVNDDSGASAYWLGANCTRIDGDDAWVPEGPGVDQAWYEFGFGEEVVPLSITIAPRTTMATWWYEVFNPTSIDFYMVQGDGSEVFLEKIVTPSWYDDIERTLDFTARQSGVALKWYITTQRWTSEANGHTSIGTCSITYRGGT